MSLFSLTSALFFGVFWGSLQVNAAIPTELPLEAPGVIKPERPVAPSFELSLNYSIRDAYFGVPSYTINEGEAASLVKVANGKKYYLDMLAVNEPEDNKAGLLRMVFLAGILNPDGSKTEISRSALVARLGKTSRVSVANEDGKSDMSLAVTARKKN